MVGASPVERIFVCASNADRCFCAPFVGHVRAALSASDPQLVFYDGGEITQGSLWAERVERELVQRPTCVVILSIAAQADPRVRHLVRLALRTAQNDPARRIVSMVIERCNPASLEPGLAAYPSVHAEGSRYDEAFASLLALLRGGAPIETVGIGQALHGDAGVDAARTSTGGQVSRESGMVRGGLASAPAYACDPAAVRDAALQALEQSLYDPDPWRALADAYLQLDQLTEALGAFEHARAYTPVDHVTARLELVAAQYPLVIRQQQVLALEALDRVPDPVPNQLPHRQRRVGLLAQLGRTRDALEASRLLTEKGDATWKDWLARARLARLMEAGSTELDICIAEVRRLKPDNHELSTLLELLRTPLEGPDGLPSRLTALDFTLETVNGTEIVLPPLCDIPAGECVIGSDPEQDADAFADEVPQQRVSVPAFQIARFPVTIAEYARFVRAGYRPPFNWDTMILHTGSVMTNVSWLNASAYAAWLSGVTGQGWRLPTEVEWEVAARWDPEAQRAHRYPWGDAFERTHCNTYASELEGTSPPGFYPTGASPCGAQDMAGNVWEWTNSVYQRPTIGLESSSMSSTTTGLLGDCVLRGGSWDHSPRLARAACRGHRIPFAFGAEAGFRLVRDVHV